MLRTLIRQELLVHLMSARFFAAVVITVLLVVANTFVLLGAYEERLANYSQREAVIREKIADAPTYSVLRLAVARPPNPLSLFSAGLDTRFGSSVDISHTQVPSLLSVGAPLSSKNPYLNLFSHIDLVFLFQVVLSLLALLFAYDAIAGDSEAGTLRLVLSHSVGRGAVLFAKYLAAMVCLLLPLLMSLLLVLIQCTLSRSLQLGPAEFLRIGGIVVTTVVYLSGFYLIGLLISTMTRRAATSLILCMFVWVVLVLVYPNWSRFAIEPIGDTSARRTSTYQQIDQMREEEEREERRFLANSPLTGKPPWFNIDFSESWRRSGGHGADQLIGKLRNTADPLVPHLQQYHAFMSQVQTRLAEKEGLAKQQMVAETYLRRARWDERLMKLSPASLYTFATAAWAGTDVDGIVDYLRATRRYRRTFITYLQDKEAFASQQWFATNDGPVNWADLPPFRFQPAAVGVYAQRALPELLVLLLINVGLFMGTFLMFVKMEV